MAYPFPSHTTPSYTSPYLGVPATAPRSRSNSRHSHHHHSHGHSGHRDHTVYPPNVVYTHSDRHHYPSSPSHHSTHHHRSHSSHHLPTYHPPAHSTHSTRSHRSRSHSHSRSYVPTYQYRRERAPSISDRIRNFFGMDQPDHYSHRHHQSHHQPHYYPGDHRARHNSFSSFRDEPKHRRSNSVRTGPWFFGSVDNRRYMDEHGREVDHRGRVIHRM